MGLHYTSVNETLGNITTTTTSKTVEGIEGVRIMLMMLMMLMMMLMMLMMIMDDDKDDDDNDNSDKGRSPPHLPPQTQTQNNLTETKVRVTPLSVIEIFLFSSLISAGDLSWSSSS